MIAAGPKPAEAWRQRRASAAPGEIGVNRAVAQSGSAAALLLVACLGFGGLQDASAAPDQAAKDWCTAYAQRAVQQYQLMKSHAQCQQNTDPLNWQDNYDNHYNGCLLFGQKVSKLAEGGRINHLQACGALSDAGAASSAGNPAASASAPVAAVPTAPAMDTAAAVSTPDLSDPECQGAAAGPGFPTIAGTGSGGSQWTLSGNVLSYVDAKTNQRVSYTVVRPHFVLVQMHCTGKPADNTGTWVWAAPDGKSGKQFVVAGDGQVLSADMSGPVTQQMIAGH